MSAPGLLMGCVAALLVTAVTGLMLGATNAARRTVYSLSMLASVAITGLALTYLLGPSHAPLKVVLPLGIPWIGAHFRLDATASFFLVVTGLGGAAASLYGLGYGRHEASPGRGLPFVPAFLAGMNMVLLADDAFSFLLSWEFMSLTSWALVMADHQNQENRRAGYIYLVMAGFGTLALLLAFGLLAGFDGAYSFDAIRATGHSPTVSGIVLLLVLLGAGSKAGIVPLHVWLPLAHPAVPSHVSALMSGVMTKVAIYAFVRIMFDLLGPPTWWSCLIVLTIGGVTAVLGVLYALMQHDLKRLLAYHTVENIGIIYIGLGLALAFEANRMSLAAALALVAALFHVFNHALFKSLLFFGAGAVLTATGERDMDRLGGLIHRMPVTSFLFLVACVAISALPPLNGFVSEWLTFQAILQSPALPQWGLKTLVPATGGLLALSAALASACFVKAFGITFLGRARSAAAEKAAEVDRFSLTAMAIFAALCLLAGILPGFVIDGLAPVTQSLIGNRLPVQMDMAWLSIEPIARTHSSYDGLLVFIFIALSAGLAAFVIHRVASRAWRRGPAWGCGFDDPGHDAQYTAGGFAQPIRRVYGTLVFRVREKVSMPPPGSLEGARFSLELHDLVWDGIYAPIDKAVGFATDRLNPLQFLTIRQFLSIVFVALVGLLLVMAIWF